MLAALVDKHVENLGEVHGVSGCADDLLSTRSEPALRKEEQGIGI